MKTRRISARSRTMLDRLRRSRSLACTTLLTTLFSIVAPVIPKVAFAQVAIPANPGNSQPSPGPSNAGLQQGQTNLGMPETGPGAALGALATGALTR